MQQQGQTVDQAYLDALRARYGIGQSFFVQYTKWATGLFHGDWGLSFQYMQPVSTLIASRLPMTLLLGIATLLMSWVLALPGGVYSAVRQRSWGDYTISGLSFVALAVPGFLGALVLAYFGFRVGMNVGGLFSSAYANAPWSPGKVIDLLKHLWMPMVLIGFAGTASIIRIVRANLLDELHKPYVTTARAKGMSESGLILKYPVRIALNPFFSTVGWHLPAIFDGEVIVAQVLALGTVGPLMLGALQAQDMYLAGGILLIVSILTVIGTFISDLLLAAVDPRVRFGRA
jgi:peptide/nickel transport system permease protein